MRKLCAVLIAVALAAFAALCLAACESSPEGPIYLVTKNTAYYENGDILSEMTYEYDENGNLLKQTTHYPPSASGILDGTTTVSYGDYDRKGYYKTFTDSQGDEHTMQWTIKDGHAVSSASDNGVETTFEYYDSGKLKRVTTDAGEELTTSEYDENGRQIGLSVMGGPAPYTTEYEWTLDDRGHAAGLTSSTWSENIETISKSYRIEIDDNWKISDVYDEETGKLWRHLDYVEIEKPSTYAWIQSFSVVL